MHGKKLSILSNISANEVSYTKFAFFFLKFFSYNSCIVLGGKFKLSRHSVKHNKDTSYEEFELGSMANALGMTKNLALTANSIHHEVGKNQDLYDAEVFFF